MTQIKWTESALNDLDEIAEYIALDKPGVAKKLVKSVFKSKNDSRISPNLERSLQNYPIRDIGNYLSIHAEFSIESKERKCT